MTRAQEPIAYERCSHRLESRPRGVLIADKGSFLRQYPDRSGRRLDHGSGRTREPACLRSSSIAGLGGSGTLPRRSFGIQINDAAAKQPGPQASTAHSEGCNIWAVRKRFDFILIRESDNPEVSRYGDRARVEHIGHFSKPGYVRRWQTVRRSQMFDMRFLPYVQTF